MKSLRLSDGSSMPSIGYGTWRCDRTLLKDAVVSAISSGYRHLDCAAIYQNEDVVGEAIAHCIQSGNLKREDLFITTKLMPTEMHVHSAKRGLLASLEKLQLSYVDLYLLHWPCRYVEKPDSFPVPLEQRLGYDGDSILDVWRVLEECVDAGLVRSLGVSNFTRKKMEHLLEHARVKPVCNQIELHPALAQSEVLQWHSERGIVVTGYCPLGSPGRPPAFRHGDEEPESLTDPLVIKVAAAHGKTPAQVLLKWATQRGTVPLPKSTTPARIIENLGAADESWSLSNEDMSDIATLDKRYRYNRGENFCTKGQTWQELWDEDL